MKFMVGLKRHPAFEVRFRYPHVLPSEKHQSVFGKESRRREMSLVRYELWSLLNQLHNKIDHVFNTRLDRYEKDSDQLVSSNN